MIEMVSFDCYGTLVDWETGLSGALKVILAVHPRDDSVETLIGDYIQTEMAVEQEEYRSYREVMATTIERIFMRRGVILKPQERHVLARTLPWWPLFTDVRPALEALKARGVKLAILSNIDRDMIAETLKRIGVPFDFVVTAEDVRSYKPAPAHWNRLLDLSHLPKEQILHVSSYVPHDIAPASNLGFSTIWINRAGRDVSSLPTGAKTVRTLMAVADYV